ncbi:MAG: SRPBCC domain-containing protein, partial [Candidatus Moraniibacteriota bacterium]
SVDLGKSFTGSDYFCDENGKRDENMPTMEWKTEFVPEGSGTKLISTITYLSGADLEKILSMGMEAGYTMALNQLEELLAK